MKLKEKPIIKLLPSRVSGLETLYINEALEKNELSYHGSFIRDIENHFETYFKRKKTAALNSGTSAIHLALIMAGVQKGDEVLCQTFTYAASAFPISYIGAKPVFIESEEESWNMCPDALELAVKNRLENGIKPKAIIVVHSYGMPCKIDRISKIASRYNIPLIEDAAEALGSEVHGNKCGSFGDYGIISFNTNKIITASGGGLLICNSEEEKKRVSQLATQAKANRSFYHHKEIGFNYKMNNINAAILKAQLTVFEEYLIIKRKINDFYKSIFNGYESIMLLDEYSRSVTSNFWLNCILVKDNEIRSRLERCLLDSKIETRRLWKPMHLQPVFKECLHFGHPNSEKFFETGLCLPSGTSLTIDQLNRIREIIDSVLNKANA